MPPAAWQDLPRTADHTRAAANTLHFAALQRLLDNYGLKLDCSCKNELLIEDPKVGGRAATRVVVSSSNCRCAAHGHACWCPAATVQAALAAALAAADMSALAAADMWLLQTLLPQAQAKYLKSGASPSDAPAFLKQYEVSCFTPAASMQALPP